MAVQTFTSTGAKASTAAKLNKEVFGIDVKDHQLLHQAYEAYRANGRERYAQVKDRSEVRGGGKKPWKQKGTGRARHGSIRSPIWRGGGVTFGPSKDRNYSKDLNKKAKRTAIRQALSLAAKHDTVSVIDSVKFKDGKTKEAVKLFEKMKLDRGVLLVVEDKTPEITRATNNIPFVRTIQANYLNVFDVLNAHNIVITKKSLDIIDAWLTSKGAKDV